MKAPDEIRVSKSDAKVFLYYKRSGGNYLCVIAKHQNGKGFIITVYITNKIKEGKTIWKKQQKTK